jgi:hypothetical protein
VKKVTTNQKWVAGILLALIVGVGYWYTQDPTLGGFLAAKKPGGDGTPPPGEDWLGGTFSLIDKGRNSLDSSGSLTTGTNYDSSWYAYRGGNWVFLGAGSGSGVNIESIAEDDGYLWLLVEEKSSQYYYADTTMTLSKNTYMTDYRWVDADGDTDREFIYKCSLWNIPKPASGYPSRTFYPYFLAESGQGTAANALQWQTQPSDISSIGTSTTTKYIGWETKLTAEKRAVGIYKIVIEVNSTSTTKWEIDKVNVPGVGYLDGSLFDEVVLTSKTQYTYKIGTDFDDIVYWKVPSGTNNKFDNTVAVKFTLSSGDVLQFTLYVYQWLYNRVSISDSDAVVTSA